MMHSTKSILILIAISAALCGCISTRTTFGQTSGEPEDVVTVDTNLTNLLFIASDKSNRFHTTLKQEDVRLLEDGIRQTITTFQRETDRPLSMAFLIDVSASEEHTLPQEKAAARAFIETVIQSRKDQAAIIAFTGPTFLEQDLTHDVLSLYTRPRTH